MWPEAFLTVQMGDKYFLNLSHLHQTRFHDLMLSRLAAIEQPNISIKP